jgi:predicted component of type VI protein secretion system
MGKKIDTRGPKILPLPDEKLAECSDGEQMTCRGTLELTPPARGMWNYPAEKLLLAQNRTRQRFDASAGVTRARRNPSQSWRTSAANGALIAD